MSFVRALRRLVLGETWVLPLAIAVAVGVAAILSAVADPGWWHQAGGPILTALTVLALGVSLRARS
jgi:hypothetical protein